jgi:quercetin dioxygenase-like cupin family protein
MAALRVYPGRGGQDSLRPPAGRFTGTVWMDPIVEGNAVRAACVVFEPGARTFWHSHPGEQLLHVVAGQGTVAARDGTRQTIRAGDLVHVPEGEEHWHGAQPGSLLIHVAITLGPTEWLEEVTPEDYEGSER